MLAAGKCSAHTPQLVAKRQTRGAAGRWTAHEGPEGPPDEVIDRVAELLPEGALDDAVPSAGRAPRSRHHDHTHFDAMFVKVREDRSVKNLACYLALGVTIDGDREVLGIWWQETEGSKFWLEFSTTSSAAAQTTS